MDLHHLHHAQLLIVHHVATDHEAAREIEKSRAEGQAAVSRQHAGIEPYRLGQRLATTRLMGSIPDAPAKTSTTGVGSPLTRSSSGQT
jgi:hypothetical protein